MSRLHPQKLSDLPNDRCVKVRGFALLSAPLHLVSFLPSKVARDAVSIPSIRAELHQRSAVLPEVDSAKASPHSAKAGITWFASMHAEQRFIAGLKCSA